MKSNVIKLSNDIDELNWTEFDNFIVKRGVCKRIIFHNHKLEMNNDPVLRGIHFNNGNAYAADGYTYSFGYGLMYNKSVLNISDPLIESKYIYRNIRPIIINNDEKIWKLFNTDYISKENLKAILNEIPEDQFSDLDHELRLSVKREVYPGFFDFYGLNIRNVYNIIKDVNHFNDFEIKKIKLI